MVRNQAGEITIILANRSLFLIFAVGPASAHWCCILFNSPAPAVISRVQSQPSSMSSPLPDATIALRVVSELANIAELPELLARLSAAHAQSKSEHVSECTVELAESESGFVEDNAWWQTSDPCKSGQGQEAPNRSVQEADFGEMRKPAGCFDVLVEVVNDYEYKALFHVLKPLHGAKFDFYIWEELCFVFGVINDVKVVAVQTSQSADGPNGSAKATAAGVNLFKPKAVCFVGVGFGTPYRLCQRDENMALHLGDVMVSDCIIPYEHAKDDKQYQAPSLRGTPLKLSVGLAEKLKRAATTWTELKKPRYVEPAAGRKGDSTHCTAVIGTMLSGGKLFNNEEPHAKLIQSATQAGHHPIGGEMEGEGAQFAITNIDRPQVIVIKGVCDWGANKCKNFQSAAAHNAFSFLTHIITELSSIEQIGLKQGVNKDGLLDLRLTVDNAKFDALWDGLDSLDQARQQAKAR